MGDDMTDEKIKDIFQRCYNKFWCKWREVPLTNDSPEWDEIVKEHGEIRKTFDCELCNHIMLDLLEELENRSKEREAKNEQKPV